MVAAVREHDRVCRADRHGHDPGWRPDPGRHALQSVPERPGPADRVQPGPATLLGNTLSLYDYYRKNIRNYRWSFGFQHEIMRDLQVEVNYVGQRAENLITSSSASDSGRVINAGWNGTGRNFRSELLCSGRALERANRQSVQGAYPAPSSLAGDTITVAQLLMPYPQYGNVTLSRTSGGSSYYNSIADRA